MVTAADVRLARVAANQDSVFTLEDARSALLTHAQIDHRVASVWTHMHEGVYRMPGVPASLRGKLRAACLAEEGAAVSHRSAAQCYVLPGRRDDIVEITCPRWERTRRSGLIVHESRHIRPWDITDHDGIPIVTAELAIMQLAWWKPNPNYVEAVIHAARRNRLITYDSMLATFSRHRRHGLRGVKATRIALERWNPARRATGSERETMLLQALRGHGLPEPVPQFEVYDRNGLLIAITDFGYPQWDAVVEYDSDQEHLDEFQIARDERRRNRISGTGKHYFVARNADLRTGGHNVCEQILELASLRQAPPA